MDKQRQWFNPQEGDLRDDEKENDKRQRAISLLAETAKIEQRQSAWYELNLWNSTLYNNRELVGFRWGAQVNDQRELWPTNLRTENLVENIGQTMLAKAASSPLRPTLIPHGASWKTAKAVRIADRFLYGLWTQTKADDVCLEMFNDTYTSGLGAIEIDFDKASKSVAVESVFFDNIVIDNQECGNRAPPRTVRIRRVMPRAVAEAKYGCTLSPNDEKYTSHRPIGDDYVVVVKAWRRPDYKGLGGYTMTACDGHIIHEGVWKHKWIPVVFLHWQDRMSGFFTKGGVEQVIPYQVRQNELNDAVQESQQAACRASMMAQASGSYDWSNWNKPGVRLLLYTGMKPEPIVWPTNLAELYGERERNKAAAYSHMGLSEMFAMGDVPDQVRFDSSAGLREARNMEDARHLRLWKSFEAARLEVARTMLYVLSSANESDTAEVKTVYRPHGSTTAGREIEYKAIKHLTENEFTWSMSPASLNTMSAAARREQLRDWASRAQANGTGQGALMVANPDLEMIEQMELASEEDIERHLELLEDGDYEAPDEMTNLSKGMAMVTANYHRLLRYKDVKKSSAMIQNHIKWVVTAATRVRSAMPTPPDQMTPFAPTQGMPGTQPPGPQ